MGVVCRASALIELLRKGYPNVVEALQAVEPEDEATLKRLYEDFPTIDFSRHVATGQEHRLSVTIVPACGWNDLGTPRRLARQRTRSTGGSAAEPGARNRWINLTERLAQIQAALGPET